MDGLPGCVFIQWGLRNHFLTNQCYYYWVMSVEWATLNIYDTYYKENCIVIVLFIFYCIPAKLSDFFFCFKLRLWMSKIIEWNRSCFKEGCPPMGVLFQNTVIWVKKKSWSFGHSLQIGLFVLSHTIGNIPPFFQQTTEDHDNRNGEQRQSFKNTSCYLVFIMPF